MEHRSPENNTILEELTDGISTQIWQMIDERTYGYANATHATFLGKLREEIQNKPLHAFLPLNVADICVLQNKKVFQTKSPVISEEWVPDASGTLRLLRIVKSPHFDTYGNVSFISCVADDVTEERVLAAQNQMHTRILNAIAQFSRILFSDSPSAIADGLATLGEATQVDRVYYWENHYDATEGIWLASQRVEWCAAEIEAQINNPELQNLPLEAFSDFMGPLQKKRPFIAHVKDLELETTKHALSAQQIQSILVLPVFIDLVFLGFVGFDSCVSEREWTQEEISLLEMFVDLLAKALQRSALQKDVAQGRDNFDQFFNTIDDLLFILDLSGTILHVNKSVIEKTGYTEEELVGQSVLLVHPDARHAEAQAIVTAMIAGEAEVCPIPIQTKDGMQFPVLTRVCKGVWNGKPALFGVTQDTTQEQFAAEKFAQAFNSSSQMMAIVDTDDGKHIEVNKAYCTTLGYDRHEIIDKTPFELNLFASTTDEQQAIQVIREITPITDEEKTIVDRSGNTHHVILNVIPIQIGVLKCELVSILDITERKKMESELKRYNENLEEMVQEKIFEIGDALWGTVSSLVHLAESRDDATGGHLRRLSDSCRVVATVLSFNSVYSEQLNYEFIYHLQQACLLHDIGKVGIPDTILLKPGKLTREEFDEMKKHTSIGAETLRQAYPRFQNNGILKMAIDIALSHHERWDGKGYPDGLKGDEIPLSAQIVAICDVYDALRSVRPYKPAFTHQESMLEIRRECGTHFNPAICDAFNHCAEEIRHIYDIN